MFLVVATRERTLVRETSPDGWWTVVVTGVPRFFGLGGVEVQLGYYGSDGGEHSQGVIDQCVDWAEAEAKYGAIEITNEQANVEERVTVFPE